jgi:hypothetical protein
MQHERLRLAAVVFATMVGASVLAGVLPDLSHRMWVAAQQAYYYRQAIPQISSDGVP